MQGPAISSIIPPKAKTVPMEQAPKKMQGTPYTSSPLNPTKKK